MGGQKEWEGRKSGRAGGMGGQEEWEGRRAGLVQTPRRPLKDIKISVLVQKLWKIC